MENGSYKTIKSPSKGIYKEKGSRFLAFAYPVSKQEDIRPLLDSLRKEYHDARHHCYAYMIGHQRSAWRINDDGEPSGTAGRPILGQINSTGLTNILIVVVRYFGGTLLGVSGLINAYKTAAADAIKNSEAVEMTLHDYYMIKFPYAALNELMKVLKEEAAGQSEQRFGIECSMVIYFKITSKDKIISRIARINELQYKYIETK